MLPWSRGSSVVIAMHGLTQSKKSILNTHIFNARYHKRSIYRTKCRATDVTAKATQRRRLEPPQLHGSHAKILSRASTQKNSEILEMPLYGWHLASSFISSSPGYHPSHKVYSSTQSHAPVAHILVQSAARSDSQEFKPHPFR